MGLGFDPLVFDMCNINVGVPLFFLGQVSFELSFYYSSLLR